MPGKAEATPKAAKTKKPEPKNKGGRPFAITLDGKVEGQKKLTVRALLTNLGSTMCTQREAAAILGISEPTIIEFFKREPEAKELFERGVDMGKVSLRRNQFNLSKTNATMGIFLGMQYLGQEDKRRLGGYGDKGGIPIDLNVINNMPMEQLVALLGRIESLLGSTPDAAKK